MNNLITTNQIEETKAYKELQRFQKDLIIKRSNRQILEEAFIYYQTTGIMLTNLNSNNLKILTEIIKKNESKPNPD